MVESRKTRETKAEFFFRAQITLTCALQLSALLNRKKKLVKPRRNFILRVKVGKLFVKIHFSWFEQLLYFDDFELVAKDE